MIRGIGNLQCGMGGPLLFRKIEPGSLSGLDDLELDAAVVERLLGDGVALLPGFEPGLLNGVELKEVIELPRIAPVALEVVVRDLAGGRVDDSRVQPAGQRDEQSGRLAREELCGALDRCWEPHALAGNSHCQGIFNTSLDHDNVAHATYSPARTDGCASYPDRSRRSRRAGRASDDCLRSPPISRC